MRIIFIILFFIGLNANAQLYRPQKVDIPDTVFHVTFSDDQLGNYDSIDVENDFNDIKWSLTGNRGAIIEDNEHGKVLRVKYPRGSVGPQNGGIQFVRKLPQSKEYYLDYYFKAEKGFDFNKGGKLPGLTSGGSKYTGGIHPDNGDGWTARYMWTEGGGLIVYLYYVDMHNKYGDHLPLKGAKIVPGKWHRITQHIILNDGNKHNGKIEVWFDEKKLVNEKGLRLRMNDMGLIDAFYFSTFHGGSSQDWAPHNDSFFQFDDFTVSKVAPGFISK